MNDIRLAAVRQQLRQACADVGRVENQVKLIAVSKFHDVPTIADVLEAGHRFFGESRVQEAQVKWPDLRARFPNLELHLIGSLQQNKAVAAVRNLVISSAFLSSG
jgi:uncharacterized pyridoxal phosphate-containing UPF0001 family protein